MWFAASVEAVTASPRRPVRGCVVAAMVLLAVPAAQWAVGGLGLRLSGADGLRLALSLTLAPLVEEFVFRALLQRGLQQALQRRGSRMSKDRSAERSMRMSTERSTETSTERSTEKATESSTATAVAAVAATVIFALAHLDDWTLPALLRCGAWLLPGAALAITWCWRQRTADCVLLHAWFNATLWWASAVTP